MVHNVGGWPERRLCVSFGVAYCMGPFTTAPDEEMQSGEISQGRLVLIERLNLLRTDADLSDIADVAKLVERLHLSAQIKDVLLSSAGPFGRSLLLAIALEKGRTEHVSRLAQQVAIPLEDIEKASADAMQWAETAVRLSQ